MSGKNDCDFYSDCDFDCDCDVPLPFGDVGIQTGLRLFRDTRRTDYQNVNRSCECLYRPSFLRYQILFCVCVVTEVIIISDCDFDCDCDVPLPFGGGGI